MQFADSAFTVNAEVAKSLNMRRQLRSDAVPTIDSIERRVIWTAGWYVQNYTNKTTFAYICKHKREMPCCLKNVSCYLQQALREVSRIVRDVDPAVENIEDAIERNAVGIEPTNDTQEQVTMCSKCDALASRVVKLQKKISWLKKSKKKLNDSLNVVYIDFLLVLESRYKIYSYH